MIKKHSTLQKGLILYVSVLSFLIITCSDTGKNTNEHTRHMPHRIISLAPSITETLFALGLGDRIVGVTSYCVYPPHAKSIDRVGSFMAPNFEAIVALKPDLVVLLREDRKARTFLERKKIPYIPIDNQTVRSICTSFRTIGKACGREKEAERLVAAITTAIDSVASLQNGTDTALSRPAIMLCVGRGGIGAGEISTIWLAGTHTYYDDIIRASGGVNVVKDSAMAYLTFSSEGVIRLKPDIIIDVMANMSQFNSDALKRDWKKLTNVPAVKNDMIFCLSGDYVTIPGPRVLLLLKDIRRIIEEYNTHKRK